MIAKSYQHQRTALAFAALVAMSIGSASALSLGRISVQSALGEPIKAEIELLDINAEEAASLRVNVAGPEAFKTASLDYNPALSHLQATLQHDADGHAYLRLSSDRAINDPFVDIIIETSWSSGRIIRDYTMLFDPPNFRNTATSAPVAAQLPAPSPARAAAAAPSDIKPQGSRPEPLPAQPTKPAPVVIKSAPAPASAPVPQGGRPETPTVKVKTGDTAGRIAALHKPSTVSLDQMLLAMLNANPDAFIHNNVNWIKAGAVITMPSEQQASLIPDAQATQTIIAQSQNFNDFRRKFASNAPEARIDPASRDISGKVQAIVEDKKPAATTPDKLTLSKGPIQGASSAEQLAQARNAQESSARSAELAKNITDLNKLVAAASIPSVAMAPVATVASAKPASAILKASQPPAEAGFIDSFLDNPLLPAGATGLIALLAALGIYKARQRKQASHLVSPVTGNDPIESFSDASGGQSIDTGDSVTADTSMVYSPSQVDAVDVVDPVAEADVYIAYGRDLQAEEILKGALDSDPQRVAIHTKLLEIYAKRHDIKAFEAIAALAFNLTTGSGSDWEQICEMGLSIDPDNVLYLPGGQPIAKQQLMPAIAPDAAMTSSQAAPPVAAEATPLAPVRTERTMDLDLDLDFSLEEPGFAKPELSAPDTAFSAAKPMPFSGPSISDIESPAKGAATTESEMETVPGSFEDELDFSMPAGPSYDTKNATSQEAAPAEPENDLMTFDLNSLSLDLGDTSSTEPGTFVDQAMDPLETKLALADEFRAIGDDVGARALIEEVIAEASGNMQSKAQQALRKF